MNRITVAPARALYQEKATDLVAAGIVANTPGLWVSDALHHLRSGHGDWVKPEGNDPGGVKERAAPHMVRCTRDGGHPRPHGRIDSSNGSLGRGLGLALVDNVDAHR